MTVNNAIRLQDRMTPVLRSMLKALNSNLRAMEGLDRASSNPRMGRAFQRAGRDIQSAQNAVRRFQTQLDGARLSADRLQQSMLGASGASGGMKLVNLDAGVRLAKQGWELAKGSAEYLDNLTLIKARLDNINDGFQTTAELQEKVYQAANRSRGDYGAMASSVAKLNLLAGEAFGSNDEVIRFTELMNKSFTVAGASAQESSAAMYQLTQAMAAGRLQGDEFRSITENAPMLADAIAKQMGITKGELRDVAREGTISAGIIKNALFGAADDIEKKFTNMPLTFGQKIKQVSNTLQMQMQPVADKFSQWLNSAQAQKFFDALIAGAMAFSGIAMAALNGITWLVNTLYDLFVALQPLIMAAAIVGLGLLIKQLSTVVVKAWNAAIAFAAQHWVILLVVAGIALLIWALNQFGISTDQIIGGVCGIFGFLYGTVKNVFIGIKNVVGVFCNFIENVFTDPIGAIKMLFWDLCDVIVSGMETANKAIVDLVNLIPGVELSYSEGIANLKKYVELQKKLVEKEHGVKAFVPEEFVNPTDVAKDWYQSGSDFSKGIEDKINKLMGAGLDGELTMGGGNLDSVGKIDDEVSITEEDIKLLKDVAATEFVNRFTTLRPEMTVKFGDVHETADAGRLLEEIERMTEEALATSLV